MRNGRLVRLLKSARSALLCVLLVIASLPQVAGAHGMDGSGNRPVHLAMEPHSSPVHMTSGRCEGGRECSVQVVFLSQSDGPVAGGIPHSPYQRSDSRMVSWLMAFDPPPPRPVS
jgi:hypothetical protein